MKRSSLFCCLLLVTSMVHAQSQAPAQPQPVAASAAARPAPNNAAIEPSAVRDAGLRLVQAIDAEQAAQLWDGASSVTRKAVTRDAFVAGVAQARKPLGAALGRDWVAVRRDRSTGAGTPPGQYASAEFAVLFAGNRVARELVSFRLDEDNVWRFTGYVIK